MTSPSQSLLANRIEILREKAGDGSTDFFVEVRQSHLAALLALADDAEHNLALCATNTTAADLRQTLACIEAVLDRFEGINAAREHPSQMVSDLIAEARYQIVSQPC